MEKLVRDKFRRHRNLRDKLKATGNREIINTYSDVTSSNLFWGVVNNKGQNQLGRIIENIRYDIQTNVELEKWLFMTFNLVEDKSLIPVITLDVLKEGIKTESIILKDKSYFMMGSLTSSDILMAHQSISRHHAALIVDSKDGVCLIDLGSKGGSFIDGQRINVCFPYRLKSNQILNFSLSTRKYVIDIDYSLVEKNITYKKKQIELEMKNYEELKNTNTNPDVVKSSLGLVSDNTIFVANLPDHCSIKELKDFFEVFGKVKNVRIPIDHVSGKSRNIGFVIFQDEKDMRNALKQDGIYYKDKKIRISKAEKKISDITHIRKISDTKNLNNTIEKHEERAKKDFETRFKIKDSNEREQNTNKNTYSKYKLKSHDEERSSKIDKIRSKYQRYHSRSRSSSRSRDKNRGDKNRRSKKKSRNISEERNYKKRDEVDKKDNKQRGNKKVVSPSPSNSSSPSKSSSSSESDSESNSQSNSKSSSQSNSKSSSQSRSKSIKDDSNSKSKM